MRSTVPLKALLPRSRVSSSLGKNARLAVPLHPLLVHKKDVTRFVVVLHVTPDHSHTYVAGVHVGSTQDAGKLLKVDTNSCMAT